MPIPPKTPGDRGISAVTVAISMMVLFGMAAVAVDGSNLYRERGDVQNAADLAAYAAAYEECIGGSESDAITAGEEQATANGYTTGSDVIVSVTKVDPEWRAEIDTTITGYFSSILGASTLDTSAQAVAECSVTSGALPLIFAGGECGTDPTFDFPGNLNTFDGDLHSNGNMKFEGSNSHFTGNVTYVDPYYEGSNIGKYPFNTFDQGWPTQDVWQNWPVELDPNDYASGGPVESLYPSNFYKYNNTDVTINTSSPDGVYVIYGEGDFTVENGVTGNFTFVTLPTTEDKGRILINGNSTDLTAYHDDVLAYSNYWKGGSEFPYSPPPYTDPPECGAPAIQVSGNSHVMNGLFFAPRGMIEFNGNQSTLNGSLAGFNVKFNGNENIINTIPGGGPGDTVTVLVE